MTVGELVMTAVGRMPKPNITLMNIKHAIPFLRSLGIWDAEVLEGEFWDEPYEMPCFLDSEGAGMTFGLEDGQHVRLIVLPQEAPDETP